ncbi:MAG: hypothetical protein ACKPKO_62895, partial [Candidatus Fonsibacter sp.]
IREMGGGPIEYYEDKATIARLEAAISTKQKELESTRIAIDKLDMDFSKLLDVSGPPRGGANEEADSAEGIAIVIPCIGGRAQTLLDPDHLQKEYNPYAQGFPDGPPLGPAAWICSKHAQDLVSCTSLC